MARDIEYFNQLHKLGLPKPEDTKRMVETIAVISNEVHRLKDYNGEDSNFTTEVLKSMMTIADVINKYQGGE